MGKTLVAAADALGFLLFLVGLALVLLGALTYFCESGEWDDDLKMFMRPDLRHQSFEATPIVSIPHAFWYTIVTISTVGYGDFYPTTDAGRVVGVCTILIGMVVLAMPITVIGSAFSAEYKIMKRKLDADKRAEEAEQAEFDRLVVMEEAMLKGLDAEEVAAAGAAVQAAGAARSGGAKVAPGPTGAVLGGVVGVCVGAADASAGGGAGVSADPSRSDSSRSILTTPTSSLRSLSFPALPESSRVAPLPPLRGAAVAGPSPSGASAAARGGLPAPLSAVPEAEPAASDPGALRPPVSAASSMTHESAATGLDFGASGAVFELLLEIRSRQEAQGRELVMLRRENAQLRGMVDKLLDA